MQLFMVKGQFKDEFVTAGGVPLSEVSPSLCLSISLSNTHLHIKTLICVFVAFFFFFVFLLFVFVYPKWSRSYKKPRFTEIGGAR